MSDKKIFLLGVGCQKGGTSWLHKYLHRHPNCNFGFRKEYHVFDALHLKGEKRFKKKALRHLATLTDGLVDGRVKLKGAGKPFNQLRLVNFYRNVDTYFEYFHTLAHQKDDRRVVGDITPSYAGLPAEVLQQIKDGVESRGFDLRVVYLMRDPVERLYSATRMSLRDRKASGREVTMTENEMFLEQFNGPKAERRTRYEETIQTLDSIFDKDQLHYGFYEDLFTDARVQELTDWLNIPFVSPNFSERVNFSEQQEELSDEAAKIAREFYAPTYEFVAKRFPEHDLKALWKHY